MILDLRKNAFEATSESKRQVLFADDYKKLGFAVSEIIQYKCWLNRICGFWIHWRNLNSVVIMLREYANTLHGYVFRLKLVERHFCIDCRNGLPTYLTM